MHKLIKATLVGAVATLGVSSAFAMNVGHYGSPVGNSTTAQSVKADPAFEVINDTNQSYYINVYEDNGAGAQNVKIYPRDDSRHIWSIDKPFWGAKNNNNGLQFQLMYQPNGSIIVNRRIYASAPVVTLEPNLAASKNLPPNVIVNNNAE